MQPKSMEDGSARSRPIRPTVTGLVYNPDELAAACERLGIRLLVLFGSYARGRPVPDAESDLDLAVLTGEADELRCHRELSEVFPRSPLDVVSLGKADPLFRHEIMSVGILLHGDPDLFCEYRAYAYKDFIDSADLRALEGALFRKKMAFLHRVLHASA